MRFRNQHSKVILFIGKPYSQRQLFGGLVVAVTDISWFLFSEVRGESYHYLSPAIAQSLNFSPSCSGITMQFLAVLRKLKTIPVAYIVAAVHPTNVA